jgi:hypothetical protein
MSTTIGLTMVTNIAIGFGIATAIVLPLFGILWLITTSFLSPNITYDRWRYILVQASFNNFISALGYAILSIPFVIASSIIQIVNSLFNNALLLSALFVGASLAAVWNQYQNNLMESYIVLRQCGTRPILDFFALPVFNILRMLYDLVIMLFNFYVNLHAFYYYGIPIVAFKCSDTNEISNIMLNFANIFTSFFQDLSTWLSGDYLHDNWDITSATVAFGYFIDSLVPILTCMCKFMDFLWNALSTTAQLDSFHSFLNCFWNTIVKIFQIPINMFIPVDIVTFPLPRKPLFNTTVIQACCTAITLGTFIEDVLFIAIEMFWGAFTNTALPQNIQIFLSTPYLSIISYPVCGIFQAANVTAIALLNIDNILAPDGTGVQYFQIGFIVDTFRVAAVTIGDLFIVFNNNDIQVFASQLFLIILDLVDFAAEFIIGNLFYFLFAGPLEPIFPNAPYLPGLNIGNFLDHIIAILSVYFPNYWLRPGVTIGGYTFASALNQLFVDLFISTQVIGDLIGQFINPPIGCLVTHLLNLVLTLIQVIMNFISFFYNIVTFNSNPATTFHEVNFDNFIDEIFFFASCAGDLIRQFDFNNPPNTLACTPTPELTEQNFICCLGNLLELVIDLLGEILQQILHFLQDLLTLPSGQIQFCFLGIVDPNLPPVCIRIPDFQQAIDDLNAGLCELTCALTGIIPFIVDFKCQFPIPPPPPPNTPPQNAKNCNSVQTCLGQLLCAYLQIFTSPLQIYNSLIVNILNGVAFSGFSDFLEFIHTTFSNPIGRLIAQFGLLINCMICSFLTHGDSGDPNSPFYNTGCDDTIYQIFYHFGQLIGSLSRMYTTNFFTIVTIVLQFLIGFFVLDIREDTTIETIALLAIDITGGLGFSVDTFLNRLFWALGMPLVGSFISAVDDGLCIILDAYLNALNAVVDVLSLGLSPIESVELCCTGSNPCISLFEKKRSELGMEDDGNPFFIAPN